MSAEALELAPPRQGSLLLRVLPLYPLSVRRAGQLVWRNVLVARRGWLVFVSGFFEPFFYLLSIGVGIGGLVGTVASDTGAVDWSLLGHAAYLAVMGLVGLAIGARRLAGLLLK